MTPATQLDQKEFVLALDPKGMYDLICGFPAQCARAIEIARASSLPRASTRPDLVVLTGLGGSAAGGDFVRCLFEASSKVPFMVNRDYHLPAFVGNGALVIACSYSGNTEETLSAYADAKRKGASIVCITSGGKLADLAREDGYPLIIIPGGQPPRASMGYLLMPAIYVCQQFGLIPEQDFEALVAHLAACVDKWKVEVGLSDNPTKQLAAALQGSVSVLYGLGGWQGLVANRWKMQINENSKVMTFANAFPELNHNEILGWIKCSSQGVGKWVGVVLQDGTESAKMKKRAEVTLRLTAEMCQWHHVTATGTDLLQKAVSLALYGDFVSVYLAALNQVDPENIDSINILKAELSAIS